MHDKTALRMMQRCKSEIDSLTREVAALRPYAEAYHTIARLAKQGDLERLSTLGYREDLGYTLECEIAALEHRMREEEERAKRAADEASKTRGDPASVSSGYEGGPASRQARIMPDDAGGDAPADVD